jgi:hypothetical protein
MPQKKGHKKAKKGGMIQDKYRLPLNGLINPYPNIPRSGIQRPIYDVPWTNKYNLPIVGRQIYGTTGQGFGPAHYTRRAGSGIKIIHRGRGLTDIVSTNPFTTL